MSGSEKVLIFVVAYNAEKTITSVLNRIPVKDLPPNTEVLVIDDFSSDHTFEIARENKDAVKGLKITVLSNPQNQGYGGNQKIGYQYAIENNFDVVALLHGDGQYAPEKLPALIKPVLEGEADACFGSRMIERGNALKDGMPLYKYVGNKILSSFQNGALGMSLSEFHSGYRVYSVPALKRLPFRYNTNNFHFDTQIIIQFVMAGLRIKELPIPTYYGDEICHVNGLVYAWNVTMSTIASRIHKMGIFYRKEYDVETDKPVYDIKLGYKSSHTMALSGVSDNSEVLDVASGLGFMARELKKKNCKVTGLDREEADAKDFEKFIKHDLDSASLPGELGVYDYILALDCIEHLAVPERFLSNLRLKCYSDKTMMVLTVPNIGFFVNRFGLLLGQFNYGKTGILDLTHKRLFTFKSVRRMLEQEGFKILKMRGIPAPFPKALGNSLFSKFLVAVNSFMILLWRGMFSYQIYAEVKLLPPLEHLLSKTIETGEN